MAQGDSFTGFRPAAFSFFRGLARHNDPLWFKPRKPVYEAEILVPLRALMAALTERFAALGIPLTGDPARGIFRIYRDVRFSANKQLYKTHQGGVLTRSGGKGDPGLVYVHLEPGASMIGAGFWHPEPALLARLRGAVAGDPDGFLAMAGRLERHGYKLTCENERLTRLPRGFEAAQGGAAADYICWKNFLADAAIGDDAMQSPKLVSRIVEFTLAARPLLDWGWAAEADDIPPPLALKLPTRPLPAPDF
ncbi:MAG TPA: TIGR02453 family protein [Stellaceae bacterium]|nr:TIGR02453 family protein [Stellaceae bacterium]